MGPSSPNGAPSPGRRARVITRQTQFKLLLPKEVLQSQSACQVWAGLVGSLGNDIEEDARVAGVGGGQDSLWPELSLHLLPVADYTPYVSTIDSRWSSYNSDSTSSAPFRER